MGLHINLNILILITTILLVSFSFVHCQHSNNSFCIKNVDQNNFPKCEVKITYEGYDFHTFEPNCLEENVFLVSFKYTLRVDLNNSERDQSEAERGTCTSEEWKCKNENSCINKWNWCDRRWDCNDGSDEVDCGLRKNLNNAAQYFARISDNKFPPYGRITCTANYPMDFEFEGVDALDFFNVVQYLDSDMYTLVSHALLKPEATGKYIVRGLKQAERNAATEIFIFAERGEAPFLLGTSQKTISAKKTNENGIILPCITSDLAATKNITLYKLVESNWTRLKGIPYNRQLGFQLKSQSKGEYRCYSQDSEEVPESTDFVAVKVNDPSEEIPPNKTLTIQLHQTNASAAVCYSTQNRTDLEFINIFTQNRIDGMQKRICMEKNHNYCGATPTLESKVGRNLAGIPCPNNAPSCLWILNPYEQGLFYCENGDDGDFTFELYFRGLDNKTYTVASIISPNLILSPLLLTEVWTPNLGPLKVNTSTEYEITCGNVQYPMFYTWKPLFITLMNGTTQPVRGYQRVHFTPDVEEIICRNTLWKNGEPIESRRKLEITITNCSSSQWTCNNRQCISLTNRCDRWKHCADGSDEVNCTAHRCKKNDGIMCKNGTCLLANKKCNNIQDCAEGEDESSETCPQYIPKFLNPKTEVTFAIGGHQNELICEIAELTGGFKATLSWWRRGYNVSLNNPEMVWLDSSGHKLALRFKNLSRDDSGEWVCVASNVLKKVSQVYMVTLNEDPTLVATLKPKPKCKAITKKPDLSPINGAKDHLRTSLAGECDCGTFLGAAVVLMVILT